MTTKHGAVASGLLAVCWMVVGCQSKDPGLEEEISRLRQENRELAGRLELAENARGEVQSRAEEELAAARAELEDARSSLLELQSRFDRKRLEASFAEAVSEFREETLKKFPGHSISQVTLHQMVMPSDHPFSSGVTMVLANEEDGSTRTLHVTALGNIEGEWTFKKVDADAVAANRPETGAPPVGRETAGGDTAAGSGGAGQEPRPDPARPAVRRTDPGAASPGGGKVYRIDWGD